MGKPNGKAALYSIELRKAMGARSVSVRGLGKLTDPADPERGRRRAQRHLSGKYMPSPSAKRGYAEALEAPELLPDDDEEDSLDRVLMIGVRRYRLVEVERVAS